MYFLQIIILIVSGYLVYPDGFNAKFPKLKETYFKIQPNIVGIGIGISLYTAIEIVQQLLRIEGLILSFRLLFWPAWLGLLAIIVLAFNSIYLAFPFYRQFILSKKPHLNASLDYKFKTMIRYRVMVAYTSMILGLLELLVSFISGSYFNLRF